ncbi:glycosyltransferase family 4 protein [Clostridium perfringens]|uniref:glycosyltransferase family 4 protein n=1 Tax=Clostridium perfringens TaxID=1502 RepID=UPI001C865EA3|nr:glycosyltransferase family 4 protein [Clostridium perfringens]MDK0937059.1 glycosyltransferase family 4 protein [Clostridium perfringens]
MKKKILYVTNITRTVNTFFIPHMNMLVNEGYEVDCACKITGEMDLYKENLNNKIRFYDVPFTRNPFNFKNIIAFLKLYKIQKKNNYDIIHVHTPIAAVYTRMLKKFFPTIKMIYTAHGYHFHKNSSKLSWLIFYNIEKYLSMYTDILVTINDEDYEVSKDFKCGKLIKMNGVGVDLSKFKIIDEHKKIKIRKKLGLNEDDFVIIMVGEHNKNKNQIQLIKAIEILEKDYPKIKALFIGDGELLEKNKEYVRRNNIKNAIILGFRRDVNDLINISDIICSLSYREGLPKNILEGMASGKVVLGSNVRGVSDLVMENLNGKKVEVGDISNTIHVIKEFYNMDKVQFKKLGYKSQEIVNEYDLKKILICLRQIY